MTNNKIIFVTGGTGNQGGSVARHLAANGFQVRVLTRNPGSHKAQNIGKAAIQLVKGNLDHPETYRDHLKDVYGIFSVQTFENGVEREVNQGIALASVAKDVGIRHFVYSSSAGANLNSGVPHIESKFKIENHIQQIGIPYTIIRPASLYENFLIPQVKNGILKGNLTQAVNKHTVLQYIGSDSIGAVCVKLFQNPDRYVRRILPLATEQLSTLEVAELFSSALNRRVEYKKLPNLITRLFLGKTLYKMFSWLDKENRFSVRDVEATRNEFPDLLDLRTWIVQNFRPH